MSSATVELNYDNLLAALRQCLVITRPDATERLANRVMAKENSLFRQVDFKKNPENLASDLARIIAAVPNSLQEFLGYIQPEEYGSPGYVDLVKILRTSKLKDLIESIKNFNIQSEPLNVAYKVSLEEKIYFNPSPTIDEIITDLVQNWGHTYNRNELLSIPLLRFLLYLETLLKKGFPYEVWKKVGKLLFPEAESEPFLDINELRRNFEKLLEWPRYSLLIDVYKPISARNSFRVKPYLVKKDVDGYFIAVDILQELEQKELNGCLEELYKCLKETLTGTLGEISKKLADLTNQLIDLRYYEVIRKKDQKEVLDFSLIEFSLPPELLHLPVSQWSLKEDDGLTLRLGMKYPVVIRTEIEKIILLTSGNDKERTEGKISSYKNQLEKKWSFLKLKHVSYSASNELDKSKQELYEKICYEEEINCLLIQDAQTGPEYSKLLAFVAQYSPIALWSHQPASQSIEEVFVTPPEGGKEVLPQHILNISRSSRESYGLYWYNPKRAIGEMTNCQAKEP